MEPTFGLGQSNDVYAKYFSGKSFLNMLTDAERTSLVAYNVTFEPGCRNNWHIHHAKSGGGQVLICVDGEKCIRLAWVIEDEENVEWLFLELRGYKAGLTGIPKHIYNIGVLHGRELQDYKTGKKYLFVETASELENKAAMAKAEVGSFTTAGASVAGEWAGAAVTNLTNHVTVAIEIY